MARVACGVVLLVLLTGCGLIPPGDTPSAPVAMVSFTDRACRAIALQHGADAAANGYDRGIQGRAMRDSYRTCLAIKDLHGGTP
jgi:hypothetical protein